MSEFFHVNKKLQAVLDTPWVSAPSSENEENDTTANNKNTDANATLTVSFTASANEQTPTTVVGSTEVEKSSDVQNIEQEQKELAPLSKVLQNALDAGKAVINDQESYSLFKIVDNKTKKTLLVDLRFNEVLYENEKAFIVGKVLSDKKGKVFFENAVMLPVASNQLIDIVGEYNKSQNDYTIIV